jgi:hypothetical protein
VIGVADGEIGRRNIDIGWLGTSIATGEQKQAGQREQQAHLDIINGSWRKTG